MSLRRETFHCQCVQQIPLVCVVSLVQMRNFFGLKKTENFQAPLSSTNYLFELDKLTQDVINTVTASRKIGVVGPVKYKNSLTINVPSDMNASQLNRLRRQFLNYNKLHTSTGSNLDTAAQLFVQFLNSNFNK